MKKILLITCLLLLSIIFLKCASVKPQVKNFHAEKEQIAKGDSTTIFWNVEGVNSVSISGIGSPLGIAGTCLVKPEQTTTYHLSAVNGDNVIDENIKITVIQPSVIEDNRPKIITERSEEKSKYLQGIIPIESVDNKSKFTYEIFAYDRMDFPNEIKIFVIVKDEFGNFIANLAPPYGSLSVQEKFFKSIEENVEGKDYSIEKFSVNECHDKYSEPYNFSLVLDHSGSMIESNAYENMQNAARKFINKKAKDDKISVFKFDHRIIEEVPLMKNKDDILNKYQFDGITRFGGYTALIAAGDAGVYSLSPEKKNRAVILFTDGLENASQIYSLFIEPNLAYKPSQLIFDARNYGTKIYTIGYGQADKKILEKIAILTDGKFYYANDGKEIEQIYGELPRMFQNYYVLSYKPANHEGMHNITLTGLNPDGSDNKIKGATFIGNKIDIKGLDDIPPQVIAMFQFGKADLEQEFARNVDGIANYLKIHKKAKIEIRGHSDSKGTDMINQALSDRRANIVKESLIQKGIPENRIIAKGFAFTKPIWNPEEFDWQASENRRVEVIIID